MRKAGKCQTSPKKERWLRRCSWVSQKRGWKWQIASVVFLKCVSANYYLKWMCWRGRNHRIEYQHGWRHTPAVCPGVTVCDWMRSASTHACRSTWSLEIQHLPNKCKYTQHMPNKKQTKKKTQPRRVFFKLLSTLGAVHGRPPPSF